MRLGEIRRKACGYRTVSVAAACAALILGCGGGGAATRASADATSGGVAVTTGTLTSGGTTSGSGATGGAGTTGGSETSGGTTTGSATTGTSTAGGSTTGSTTGGSETTGSSSTGSSTNGSSSAGGSTTGGTAGSSTGGGTGPVSGNLRANAIYFGHWNDLGVVSSVFPDGTGRQDTVGGNPNVVAAVPDPQSASGSLYAIVQDGSCRLYRGTTFVPAASTSLAPDAFDYVNALAAASDGTVALVAAPVGGTSTLYVVADGAATRVDDADGAAITRDGSTIVYSKSVDGAETLFTWNRTIGSGAMLASGGNCQYPSFSADGAWVVFSSDRDGGSSDTPFDLYQIPTAGGSVDRITNTPDVSELGASYNEGRTMVSYAAFSSAGTAVAGVYVRSNTSVTKVASDDDVRFATYWTDSLGRAQGRRSTAARFQRLGTGPSVRKDRIKFPSGVK